MKADIKILFLALVLFFTPVASFGATASVTLAQGKSATLALSPPSASVVVGDIFPVAITLDTKGSAVDGVDIIYLNYNPSLLEAQDDDPSADGVQISKGSLMSNTVLNAVDATLGKISFSQVADASSSYAGAGTLATARFKALAAGMANVTFDFTPGDTTDTNVASDGVDILTAAANGAYTITAGGSSGGTTSGGTTSGGTSSGGTSGGTTSSGGSGGGGYTPPPTTSPAPSTATTQPTNTASSTTPTSIFYSDGTLLKSADKPEIYVISGSQLRWIPSAEVFNAYGYSWDNIKTISLAELSASPKGVAMTLPSSNAASAAPQSPYLPVGVPDGSLVRGPDGIKVYIVNYHGYKRHIFNPAIFNMYGHFKWDQIKTLDQQTLDFIKTSDFYRADGDTRVFSLKEINETKGLAQKRWMNISGDKFTQLGYKWEQVFIINAKERDYYQEGTPLSEQELASGIQQQVPVAAQPVEPAPVKILSGMLVKSPDDPAVYYITPALLKKQIPSIEVFNSYNNQWANVKAISQRQLDSIAPVIAIRLVGSTKVYFLDNNAKRWVKTQDAFYRLGLDWNKVVQVNQTELNYYPEGSPVE